MSNNHLILRVNNIGKTYFAHSAPPVEAIANISFEMNSGEFVSIVGPSGCGKTTILKIIAGLIMPTCGTIDILDFQSEVAPDIMLVFQEYNRSLFQWRTVFRNVTFGLEDTKLSSKAIREKAFEYLKIVSLDDFAFRYPWELSGGMQQRIAIARALVCEPQILLMDEPFGSLDALSRSILEDDLLRLQRELNLTILFVTHDIDEAIYLADNVIVLSKRPSIIERNIKINICRPRHQIETKNSPAFGEYRLEISKLIGRGEYAKNYS